MHEQEHKKFNISRSESKHLFALNIGNLKKNYEEKSYLHRSFFGKNIDFLLNHVKIHVINVINF